MPRILWIWCRRLEYRSASRVLGGERYGRPGPVLLQLPVRPPAGRFDRLQPRLLQPGLHSPRSALHHFDRASRRPAAPRPAAPRPARTGSHRSVESIDESLTLFSLVAQFYGIPQHFGLCYSMGTALMVEGVLSACYHICPTHANYQFGAFLTRPKHTHTQKKRVLSFDLLLFGCFSI